MCAKVDASVRAQLHLECLWCPARFRTVQEVMSHMFGRNSCCHNPVPCQFCGQPLALYSDDQLDYDEVFWRHVQQDCATPRCPFPMCATFADRQPLTHETFEWHQQIHSIQHRIAQLPFVGQLHMYDASVSSAPHPGWTLTQLQDFNERLHEFRQWLDGCPFVDASAALMQFMQAQAPGFTSMSNMSSASQLLRRQRHGRRRRRRTPSASANNSPYHTSVQPTPPPSSIAIFHAPSDALPDLSLPPPQADSARAAPAAVDALSEDEDEEPSLSSV